MERLLPAGNVLILMGLAAVTGELAAQDAPPGTDIFLVDLSQLSAPPVNLTRRPGYRQPAVLLRRRKPDLLYTRIADGQADIYRHDLVSGATVAVLQSPESEYSPTLMPE